MRNAIIIDMGAKAGLLNRFVARAIDLVLVMAAVEALPKAGWVCGFLYILVGDGLMGGRSLGKRLLGLKVVEAGGAPCGVGNSVMRNATIGFALVLLKIPFIGPISMGAVLAVETLLMVGSDEGKRLGDEFLGTVVIETDAQGAAEEGT